ncbi:hypothetical protein ACTMU2_08595 [Cupriavidus basilensis]
MTDAGQPEAGARSMARYRAVWRARTDAVDQHCRAREPGARHRPEPGGAPAPARQGGGHAVLPARRRHRLVRAELARTDDAFGHRLNYFRALDGCQAAAQQVYADLEENGGLSVEVVFQIECMVRSSRASSCCWPRGWNRAVPACMRTWSQSWIRSTQARRSVSDLAAASFAQLARRVEAAETGEHWLHHATRAMRRTQPCALRQAVG